MNRPRSRPAFTLLEILLALALVGMLFVALNTFIFSMGELWGRNSDVRLFDQHVNAVTRYIDGLFRVASYPPSARLNSAPVYPQQITPQGLPSDTLLTFDLPAGSRLLPWQGPVLPEVTCSLQARPNDGLYLLWHSRLEMNYSTDPPRELKLTPFCLSFAYDYYNDNFKTWTTQTTFQTDSNSQPIPPQRLRLEFSYGKLQRETIIILPVTTLVLPNY